MRLSLPWHKQRKIRRSRRNARSGFFNCACCHDDPCAAWISEGFDEEDDLDNWTQTSGDWVIDTFYARTDDANARLDATGIVSTENRGNITTLFESTTYGDVARVHFGDWYLQVKFTATETTDCVTLWQGGVQVQSMGSFKLLTSNQVSVTICWNEHSVRCTFSTGYFYSSDYDLFDPYVPVSIAADTVPSIAVGSGMGIGTGAQSTTLKFGNFVAQPHTADGNLCQFCEVCGDGCEGDRADTVEVVIAGATNANTTNCADLNGTFVLTRTSNERFYNGLFFGYPPEIEGCAYFLDTSIDMLMDDSDDPAGQCAGPCEPARVRIGIFITTDYDLANNATGDTYSIYFWWFSDPEGGACFDYAGYGGSVSSPHNCTGDVITCALGYHTACAIAGHDGYCNMPATITLNT